MTQSSWYSPTERQWTFKLPGTGRVWKAVLGLVGALILLMVLFAGDKSLVSLLSLYKDRDRLAQELVEVEKTNLRLKDQINELRTHPQAVEPIAREELGLVRAGERVYRFVPEPVSAEEKDAPRKGGGSVPGENSK